MVGRSRFDRNAGVGRRPVARARYFTTCPGLFPYDGAPGALCGGKVLLSDEELPMQLLDACPLVKTACRLQLAVAC